MKQDNPVLRWIRSGLKAWTIPLILLAIAVLAYGLFTFQQGFHWDDWGFAWMPVTYGLKGLVKYYSYDRPLLAYFVYITSAIIGPHPAGWQIFGMLSRWACAVALWWVIGLVRPGWKLPAFWSAVFFLVYPGFHQQSIANAYGHYLFIEAGFFLSLGLMLKAVRADSPRRLIFTAASLILALPNLFVTDYFAGLEIIRPFLLWIVLLENHEDSGKRLKNFILNYLPYLILFGLFVYWRFFIARSLRYGIDVNPGEIASVSSLSGLIRTALDQWWTVSLAAWLSIFQIPDPQAFGMRLMLFYAMILLAVVEGLVYYSGRMSKAAGDQAPDPMVRFKVLPWLGIGLIALLGAQVPFLVSHLTIKLQFPFDRFTLPFALAISLLLAGVLELIPNAARRSLIAAILAALAVGYQIQTSYAFREDWNAVKYYLWQLSWRMPALKPGTILLSSEIPIQYSSDNSLTVPVNWMYDPGPHSGPMQYLNLDIEIRTKSGLLTLAPGTPVESDFRVTSFASTTDHAVVIAYQPPGCVRVLNPAYDGDLWVAPKSTTEAAKFQSLPFLQIPYLTAQAMPLSNLQQIQTNTGQAAVPMDFMNPEPQHTWCYYFEKADLARQAGDWAQVASIGDQAFAIPYHADDLSEYLPFIEAYARLGRWKDARDLTSTVSGTIPLLQPELCSLWQRLQKDPSMASVANSSDAISRQLTDLQCSHP